MQIAEKRILGALFVLLNSKRLWITRRKLTLGMRGQLPKLSERWTDDERMARVKKGCDILSWRNMDDPPQQDDGWELTTLDITGPCSERCKRYRTLNLSCRKNMSACAVE